MEFSLELYELYRQAGMAPAQARYREHAFAASDRQFMAQAMDPNRSEQVLANATYWFEHELRQYPAVRLDLDALKAQAERVVLVVGRESRGQPCYEVNEELGRALGRDIVELPGGHVGFATQPGDFAQELLRVLGHTERPSRK